MNMNSGPTSITNDLIDWYSVNKRDFSFRKIQGLSREQRIYRVWIFEVMSQQSTLKTVLPRYEEWIRRMPDLESLRSAKLSDILNVWKGLGYYSRARNIFFAAKEMESFRDYQTWSDFLRIKGVGEYTAKAIASIALDLPVVPIDGNVLRVASRFWAVGDPLNNQKDRMEIKMKFERSFNSIPAGRRADFAQAWIELGSQVCSSSKQPNCQDCPLSDACMVRQMNLDWREFPVPKTRKKVEKRSLFVLVYTQKNSKKKVLFRKIPSKWPLGGQWEIPWVGSDGWIGLRGQAQSSLVEIFYNYKNIRLPGRSAGSFKHAIMQFQFKCEVLDLGLWAGPAPAGYKWVGLDDLDALITTQSRKALIVFSSFLKTQESRQFLLDKTV